MADAIPVCELDLTLIMLYARNPWKIGRSFSTFHSSLGFGNYKNGNKLDLYSDADHLSRAGYGDHATSIFKNLTGL